MYNKNDKLMAEKISQQLRSKIKGNHTHGKEFIHLVETAVVLLERMSKDESKNDNNKR